MDDCVEEELLLVLLLRRRRKKRVEITNALRSKPRFWIRDIFLKREELGEFHRLVQELKNGDREYFFRYLI